MLLDITTSTIDTRSPEESLCTQQAIYAICCLCYRRRARMINRIDICRSGIVLGLLQRRLVSREQACRSWIFWTMPHTPPLKVAMMALKVSFAADHIFTRLSMYSINGRLGVFGVLLPVLASDNDDFRPDRCRSRCHELIWVGKRRRSFFYCLLWKKSATLY